MGVINLRYCILYCIMILLFTAGCNPTSEYEAKVEAELDKGIIYDSLFLGLKFGMNSKEFYAHCWELNKQNIIQQGTKNTTVLYELKGLKHPATMDFYPSFYEDKIYEMPVVFAYKGWAPWNEHLFSDSLQQDVLKLFEKWYGKGFMTIEHPEKGAAYVKVDGNRRISLYKDGDMYVKALFTDLRMDEAIEAKRANLK